MRIRITEAGRGVNIQGDGREPGTILDANKQDADYFLARGFAELVEDEEPEAEAGMPPVEAVETATAEPPAETTMQPARRRRRGG